MTDLKARLQREALEMGFDLCRICRPDSVGHVSKELAAYLDKGHHGQMGWLAERTHWRSDPSVLWPEARSVIMLGESYSPDHDPTAVLQQKDSLPLQQRKQTASFNQITEVQVLYEDGKISQRAAN